NVQVEPLVDQWYAWAHLIPPATAARNVVERHIRIMRSFISAPDIHFSAVRNPKLLGGPFIDHPKDKVKEIETLLHRTASERRDLLILSKALESLETMLQTQAKGESLQPLYALVPDPLKDR